MKISYFFVITVFIFQCTEGYTTLEANHSALAPDSFLVNPHNNERDLTTREGLSSQNYELTTREEIAIIIKHIKGKEHPEDIIQACSSDRKLNRRYDINNIIYHNGIVYIMRNDGIVLRFYTGIANNNIAGTAEIKHDEYSIDTISLNNFLVFVKCNFPEKQIILDVGCGMGGNTILTRFNSLQSIIIGVDNNFLRILAARETAPGVPFICKDAQQLDFEPGLFDLVHFDYPFPSTIFSDLASCFKQLRPIIRKMIEVCSPTGEIRFITEDTYLRDELINYFLYEGYVVQQNFNSIEDAKLTAFAYRKADNTIIVDSLGNFCEQSI